MEHLDGGGGLLLYTIGRFGRDQQALDRVAQVASERGEPATGQLRLAVEQVSDAGSVVKGSVPLFGDVSDGTGLFLNGGRMHCIMGGPKAYIEKQTG